MYFSLRSLTRFFIARLLRSIPRGEMLCALSICAIFLEAAVLFPNIKSFPLFTLESQLSMALSLADIKLVLSMVVIAAKETEQVGHGRKLDASSAGLFLFIDLLALHKRIKRMNKINYAYPLVAFFLLAMMIASPELELNTRPIPRWIGERRARSPRRGRPTRPPRGS